MTNERCGNCVGDRKNECDSVRAEVAGKLALLAESLILCHGFGFTQPACVSEAAYKLEDIGCEQPAYELVEELNPSEIA